MKRLSLALFGLALAFLSPAFAGPEPIASESKNVVETTAAVKECNWTGFYLGLNVGYGWGRASLEEPEDEDPAFKTDPRGVIAGGQMGFNYQIGSWLVLGIEGEMSGAEVEDTNNIFFEDEDEEVDVKNDLDWIAGISGRVGLSLCNNHLLLFAKGGVAFTEWHDRIVENDGGPNEVWHANTDETMPTVGGGIEYAFNCHWSIKAEYKHYFVDDPTLARDEFVRDVVAEENKVFHTKRQLDSVLFGFNYKF